MNAPVPVPGAAADSESHTWETALLRLLDDPYVFASTGPRQHPGADWAEDVLAVLRRENADPRGWAGLDWDRDGEERAAVGPSFPFRADLTAAGLRAGLYPVDRASATDLLASFTQEWTFEVTPLYARTPAELEAVREDARTLLRRYEGAEAGDTGTTYWTTSPWPARPPPPTSSRRAWRAAEPAAPTTSRNWA